ncbi:MAG: universal stress protein [Candidatus Syntrophopropionicum ammoniitolerans]
MEHKLLVASDGSENALRAAEFAAELAEAAPNIKVTVIIVNDILDKIKYYSLRTPTVIGEVDAFFKEQAQEALDLTLKIFTQKGVKATGVVKMGGRPRIL